MGSGLLSREEARGSPARSRLETFEDETRGWEAPTTAGPCTSNRPRGRPCSTVGQWPVRATRAVAGSTDTASGVAERLLPNGPQRGTKWHTGTSVCHFQTGRHVLIEQIATSPTRKNPEQGPFQSSPTLVYSGRRGPPSETRRARVEHRSATALGRAKTCVMRLASIGGADVLPARRPFGDGPTVTTKKPSSVPQSPRRRVGQPGRRLYAYEWTTHVPSAATPLTGIGLDVASAVLSASAIARWGLRAISGGFPNTRPR